MTTINIYENKTIEDVSVLQEDVSNELSEIKELIKELQLQYKDLKKLLMTMRINDLKTNSKVDEDSESSTEEIKTEIKTDTVRGNSRNILKDENKFKILQASAKVLFKNLKLLPNGEIEHGTYNHRKFTLKYNIYDVLYIKTISDNENFTMGDFRRLYGQKEEWDRVSLYKLIYNIRNNKHLTEIIDNARRILEKDLSFTKKNNLLYINGANTDIPLHQVKDWCEIYINNNKSKDEYMWELQNKFVNLNKDYIAIIIYNYDNDNLRNVLKKEKGTLFIENNPSKRRNMIMNGGMI